MTKKNTAIVNPKKFISYLKQCGHLKDIEPPETVIIIFLESYLKLCQQQFSMIKVQGFDAGDLYLLDENRKTGIFYCRGIGAPVAVINFEELVAFGVQRFLVIGTAGSLQKNLNVSDMVLCSGALSEEGTSRHYTVNSNNAIPEPTWHEAFRSYLKKSSLPFQEGISWTTDAPYRETEEKVTALQQQGVLCVEMEISALFTVAAFHQVSISAAFIISDSLANLTWTPGFFSTKVTDAFINLLTHTIEFAKAYNHEIAHEAMTV